MSLVVRHETQWSEYCAFRESGVDWLGEVPRHWVVKRLKHVLARMASGGTPDTGSVTYWSETDEGIPWVAIGDMTKQFVVCDTEKRITEEGRQSKALEILPPGTLLYSMYASLGKIACLNMPATINQAILALIPNRQVLQPFLRWWLTFMEGHVLLLSSASTQENLNAYKVKNQPVFLPPIQEQEAIAAFLDRETAKIDALVKKKRRLMELLKEKRSALITHAVTKGLDPAAPLRDSGIPWLGRVPAHWKTGNVRRFAKMKTGHTPSRQHPGYWEHCSIPWFTLSDVWQLRDGRNTYLGSTSETISELGLANSAAELLPAGTVVFSRTASVGFSGVMPVPMATSQDFWNWVPDKALMPQYLLFQFRAMRDDFLGLTDGSTHKTVYQAHAASMMIAVPPLYEQSEIVSWIQNRSECLDKTADLLLNQLDRLSEYRLALISAAVTGRIDVRKEA